MCFSALNENVDSSGESVLLTAAAARAAYKMHSSLLHLACSNHTEKRRRRCQDAIARMDVRSEHAVDQSGLRFKRERVSETHQALRCPGILTSPHYLDAPLVSECGAWT